MDKLPLYPYEPLNREVIRLLGNPGPSVKGFFAGQGEVIEKRPASAPPPPLPPLPKLNEAPPGFQKAEFADKQTETTDVRTVKRLYKVSDNPQQREGDSVCVARPLPPFSSNTKATKEAGTQVAPVQRPQQSQPQAQGQVKNQAQAQSKGQEQLKAQSQPQAQPLAQAQPQTHPQPKAHAQALPPAQPKAQPKAQQHPQLPQQQQPQQKAQQTKSQSQPQPPHQLRGQLPVQPRTQRPPQPRPQAFPQARPMLHQQAPRHSHSHPHAPPQRHQRYRRNQQQPLECSYCRQLGESRAFCRSHVLRDPHTDAVMCPILRAQRCEICGATGDMSHTRSHCPMRSEGNYNNVTVLKNAPRGKRGK